jgi:hypothetical protein
MVAAAIAIASARQEAAVRVRPGSRGSDTRHFYDRPTNHDDSEWGKPPPARAATCHPLCSAALGRHHEAGCQAAWCISP